MSGSASAALFAAAAAGGAPANGLRARWLHVEATPELRDPTEQARWHGRGYHRRYLHAPTRARTRAVPRIPRRAKPLSPGRAQAAAEQAPASTPYQHHLPQARQRHLRGRVRPRGRQAIAFQQGSAPRPAWLPTLREEACEGAAEIANTNVPDAMLIAGGLYAFAKDARGGVRQVLDLADGTVVQALTYDEFGRVLEDTNPGFQPFGFAGGLYDADTQLVRFGARDYDAEVGRRTSKDPIRWDGGQGNLYVYVGNDPVGFTDPTGLIAPWIAAGGVGAAINTTGYLIASDERTLRGTLSAAAGGFVTGAVSPSPFGGATFAGGLAGSLTESAFAGTQVDPVKVLWSGVSNFVGGSAGA